MANEPSEIPKLDEGQSKDFVRERKRDGLIDRFYKSEKYDELKEVLEEVFEKHGAAEFENPYTRGTLEGRVFEEMALDYYYGELNPNPENRALAEYLQNILLDPNFREVDFYRGDVLGVAKSKWLTPEQRFSRNENLDSSLTLLPDTDSRRNADALLIDIQTDEVTGHKIAKIIGILDAKVNGHIRPEQVSGIKFDLYRLVSSLKPHYKELAQSLDIGGELPEGVDILPASQLGVKIIRPFIEDYKEQTNQIPRIFVPITREEVSNVLSAMVADVVSR